jgi:hypothetical protein
MSFPLATADAGRVIASRLVHSLRLRPSQDACREAKYRLGTPRRCCTGWQVDFEDDGPQKFTVKVGPCKSTDPRFNFKSWGGPTASGVRAHQYNCDIAA